jgi:hypothetical protein
MASCFSGPETREQERETWIFLTAGLIGGQVAGARNSSRGRHLDTRARKEQRAGIGPVRVDAIAMDACTVCVFPPLAIAPFVITLLSEPVFHLIWMKYE